MFYIIQSGRKKRFVIFKADGTRQTMKKVLMSMGRKINVIKIVNNFVSIKATDILFFLITKDSLHVLLPFLHALDSFISENCIFFLKFLDVEF